MSALAGTLQWLVGLGGSHQLEIVGAEIRTVSYAHGAGRIRQFPSQIKVTENDNVGSRTDGAGIAI